MKIKQTILSIAFILALPVAVFATALPVQAQGEDDCAGADTAIIKCDVSDNSAQDSGVWYLLILGLNILTAGVGIAAVGGILYAAILYTTAIDKADQVKQAQDIIENVVIGILSYAGMYLLVNFLIPGGIFS